MNQLEKDEPPQEISDPPANAPIDQETAEGAEIDIEGMGEKK